MIDLNWETTIYHKHIDDFQLFISMIDIYSMQFQIWKQCNANAIYEVQFTKYDKENKRY